MEHDPICKEFLEMLFGTTITYLSSQNTVTANSGAKSVRLDVLVKDKAGTTYDIEMSFTDRHPCLSVNTSFAVRQNIATAWNHRCLELRTSLSVLKRSCAKNLTAQLF